MEMWNRALFLALNAGPDAAPDLIAMAKLLANWAIWLVLAGFVLAWVRRGAAFRFAVLDATLSAGIALTLAQGIGVLWYHPRPFELGLGRQLLTHLRETSFPSDHATLMFGLGLPLLWSGVTRRWGAAVLLLGVGVAWARVYLGVHFPLDMAGSALVAAGGAAIMQGLAPLLHRRVYPLVQHSYDRIRAGLHLPETVFPPSPPTGHRAD